MINKTYISKYTYYNIFKTLEINNVSFLCNIFWKRDYSSIDFFLKAYYYIILQTIFRSSWNLLLYNI